MTNIDTQETDYSVYGTRSVHSNVILVFIMDINKQFSQVVYTIYL